MQILLTLLCIPTVFTTIVALGVCTPDFAVRALLGCLFYLGGINNILMWDYVKHLVREKVTNVCPMPSAVAPLMSDVCPFQVYAQEMA